MTSALPKILLVNDDGIDAPGIQALRRALSHDYQVLVSAPMYERSGFGCALTMGDEMEVEPRSEKGRLWGYAVNGTPVDCVKFGLCALEDFDPDLVISGINRGMNVGNSIFYSGTVGGAIEASFFEKNAVAASLACWGYPEDYFDDAARVIRELIPWFLANPAPRRTLRNMNFPNVKYNDYRGIRQTVHGRSFFVDHFKLYRKEGEREYYRNLGSDLTGCPDSERSDDAALRRHEISLSLLSTDLTALPVMESASFSEYTSLPALPLYE